MIKKKFNHSNTTSRRSCKDRELRTGIRLALVATRTAGNQSRLRLPFCFFVSRRITPAPPRGFAYDSRNTQACTLRRLYQLTLVLVGASWPKRFRHETRSVLQEVESFSVDDSTMCPDRTQDYNWIYSWWKTIRRTIHIGELHLLAD